MCSFFVRRLAGSSEWTATLSRAELTQALAAAGLAAPGWKSLTVARRGESGRATMLLAGSTKIQAEDFRLAVGRALGWNRIRSNWFEIAAEGDGFLFHGRPATPPPAGGRAGGRAGRAAGGGSSSSHSRLSYIHHHTLI